MHFNDIVRVASCELGRFWLRDLSTIHLPSIGEWLWRRVSRPVQRGVSYDVSISENEESRPVPTYLYYLASGVRLSPLALDLFIIEQFELLRHNTQRRPKRMKEMLAHRGRSRQEREASTS